MFSAFLSNVTKVNFKRADRIAYIVSGLVVSGLVSYRPIS